MRSHRINKRVLSGSEGLSENRIFFSQKNFVRPFLYRNISLKNPSCVGEYHCIYIVSACCKKHNSWLVDSVVSCFCAEIIKLIVGAIKALNSVKYSIL